MNPYWLIVKAFWKPAAVALLLLATYGYGRVQGTQSANLKCMAERNLDAAAYQEAVVAAEAKRQQLEAAIAAADAKHQQELSDAQATHARLVAELRAGTVKLRTHWQARCATDNQIARSAAELDADARLREESAARIIGAADEADAQIRALQEILRAERAQQP